LKVQKYKNKDKNYQTEKITMLQKRKKRIKNKENHKVLFFIF